MNRPVVLFDGRCGFCTWCANVALGPLGAAVDLIPYQSTDVRMFGLTEEQCADAVQLVESAEVLSGSRAIARVFRYSKKPWPVIGHVLDSRPMRPIAQGVYRIVARNRGKLWGVAPVMTNDPQEPRTGE